MSTSLPPLDSTLPRIVVIGAGMGGLTFAIALQRRLKGFRNFIILDKHSDLSGTWHANTYPSAASDIPTHFYSLSTDLNPDWSRVYAPQTELKQYWKDLATKHDLNSRIAFNRKVVQADWNTKRQVWTIVIEDVQDAHRHHHTHTKAEARRTTIEAEVLVSAVGLLEIPKFPDIPGLDTFKGKKFHSSHWDSSLELRGKKVGVIGVGASAAQLVPDVAEDPNVKMISFSRTPNWCVPRTTSEGPYWSFQKLLFRYLPGYMLIYRFMMFLMMESGYLAFFTTTLRFLQPLFQKGSAKYIRSLAPEKYHDHLIPNYAMGCRRIIWMRDYLKCLNQPNVELVTDSIQRITPAGVVTKGKDGREALHELDVLVLATGFQADGFPILIRGNALPSSSSHTQPLTISQYYDQERGPKAYLGTFVPGFPNLFLIAGPNTTTGHTSVLFYEEIQIRYILDLIVPTILQPSFSKSPSGGSSYWKKPRVTSVEVTTEATEEYNERIHARLANSVFMGCTSWYRRGRDGKISSIFPGSGFLFWWWLRKVDHSSFRGYPEEEWKVVTRKARRDDWFLRTSIVGGLLIGVGLYCLASIDGALSRDFVRFHMYLRSMLGL